MDISSDKKILLVEDNPDDAELTMYALKKNNITNEVVVAKDGEEALDYIFCTGAYDSRDPDIRPVVVLLDLHLPKIDGIEVLERLRADERTKLTPVVMLTSSNLLRRNRTDWTATGWGRTVVSKNRLTSSNSPMP